MRAVDALPLTPVEGVTALRIRFVGEPSLGARVVMEFPELGRFAVAGSLALDDLPPASEPHAGPELYVLCLRGGAAVPFEWRQRAEAWMAKPPSRPGQAMLDLVLQSDRVLWRAGRALVIGAPDRFDDVLAGLIHFSFYEGELRRLEAEIDTWWEAAERDAALTHQVDTAAVRRWPHVNRMTEVATLARMRLVRITRPLEKAAGTLAGPARRLVSELALQAEVADRLTYVDDKLEVFEDLYELANDRISEFNYFRREYVVEIWIVVVLLLELTLFLVELFW